MAKIGKDIATAINCLKQGELIGIPTETVYGLAANALDALHVAKIFAAKNRPHFDPLIVHVHSLHEAEKYVTELPELARILAALFWPGPLTMVFPKNNIVPDITTSGQNTVAIRVPSHPLTLELLQRLPFPLAAPSANPFGYVSPTTAQHVNDQLGDKIGYVLDGGPCTVGLESTIVSFVGGLPQILRLGGLPVESIEEVTGPLPFNLVQNSNPTSPGQLDSHYSPRCRVILETEAKTQWQAISASDAVVIRLFEMHKDIPQNKQWILAPNGDLNTVAANLFDVLRRLDNEKKEVAIVQLAPEKGLGLAINDRLRRASF
jgi:L-threonylcarbamoyladenylate synthase